MFAVRKRRTPSRAGVSLVLSALVLTSAVPAPVFAVAPGLPGPVVFARFWYQQDGYFLWTVVAGGEPVVIPGTRGARGGRWSPDGRVIAYDVWGEGIYLINVDGSGKRLIVPRREGEGLGQPVWSPDGTKIAYSVETGGSPLGEIEIFDPAAGTTERHDFGLDGLWEWTDDYLLGYSWRNYEQIMNRDQEIARYNFGDGSLQFLTNRPDQNGVPRLSPDGTSISFVTYDFVFEPRDGYEYGGDGTYSMWVMDAEGGNERLVTQLGTQVTWPAWSPDGTEIVFGPTVEAITVDGQHRRFLGGGYGEDGFDWAPLPGTTEDFPVEGVRAMASRDPSAIASASASTTSIKPSTSIASATSAVESAAAPRSVTVRQHLAEPARATLKIFKPSGVLMRTVTYGLKTGPVAYTWNGRLPSGKLAPAGTYKFVAKAVDLAGNVKKKTMYVKVVR